MGETVVVTGASGYLGRHVVVAARDRGARVLAVTRKPDSWLREHLPASDIIASSAFDLSNDDWEAVSGADALIHLAWRDGFALRSRAHAEDLSSHIGFLTRAADSGVGRISGIGTMHEVGYWEGAVNEETPSRPATPYGMAKRAVRELAGAAIAETPSEFVWLRCYYILGDDERSNSIFNKILVAARRGDEAFPFTSGTNSYDFIPVGDLARQIVTTATASGQTGIVECCSGAPQTLAEAAETFIRDRGLDIRLNYGAFPDRPFDSPGIWGDPTRISDIMQADAAEREAAR